MSTPVVTNVDVPVDDLTTLTSELARFPSQIPNEGPLGEYLAGWMRKAGGFDEVRLQPVVPGRFNVIGIVRGSQEGRHLLLNGHTDVPHPVGAWTRDPHDGAVLDGRVHGVGLTDMKGAVASMVVAARALSDRRNEFRGEVVVSAVIHHNVCGLGTKFFLANWDNSIDAAINGEPTNLGVQLSHGGAWQFQVTTHGLAKHTSRAGVNAIDKMVQFLGALSVDKFARGPDTIDGLPRLMVGFIQGGHSASRTAEKCTVQGDIRTVPGMTEDSLRRDLDEILSTIAQEDKNFSAEFDGLSYQRPFVAEETWEIVETVKKAHLGIAGSPPVVSRGLPVSSYVTDSSDLVRAGIPTVVYGPGDWDGEPDESIAIEDLTTAAKVYAGVALEYLGE